MFRAQTRTRWLLAVCGVLEFATAAMNLLMLNLDGGMPNAVRIIGVLAVAAGACAIVAGLSKSGSHNSWLLSMHGFALAAFGLIGLSPLVRGPLSFRPVSLLFVLMAASIAAFAWKNAQALRPTAPGRSLLSAAAVISVCFALSFFAVGFNWVRLAAPYTYWIWMSSYFAFSAIFLLWLAARKSAT